MNHIEVLFFATLRDHAGTKIVKLDIPLGSTVRDLKSKISRDYPTLRQVMDTVVVSINHEFAFDESVIPDGAEVAIFPPVSGGLL